MDLFSTCCAVLIAVMTLYIMVTLRLDIIKDFRQCCDIDFRHFVLQDNRLSDCIKSDLQRLYHTDSPSYLRLFFTLGTLSRKRFYTPDQIQTYFSKI